MTQCDICGASNKPCTVYDDKIQMCGDCAFQLSIVSRNIIECIEIMEDVFAWCPNPEKLHRVFTFIGTHISGLFDGIASIRTQRGVWRIITRVCTGHAYDIASSDFYLHPEHLETIRQKLQEDMNLLSIARDDAFRFARPEGDVSDHIPPDTHGAVPGMWSIGEQLILEELGDIDDSDNDDMIV